MIRRSLALAGLIVVAALGCAAPGRPAPTADMRVPPRILVEYAASIDRLGLDRRDAPVLSLKPVVDDRGRPVGLGVFHRTLTGRWAGRWEILLDPRVLESDGLARVVLAHELAHYLLRHGDERCWGRAEACEQEATLYSVSVLERGFGFTHRDAVLSVYSFLDLVTRLHRQGLAPDTPGHRTPCEEFQDFAAHFGLPTECRSDLPGEGSTAR
jgi:hypothetical protein